MKSGVLFAVALVAVVLLGSVTGSAHHPISAKFDDTKPQTLTGVVTLVDWRNPHVHIYINVRNANDADNWAIELDSPIDLEAGGWTRDSVKAGDSISVTGIAARNGSRQVWANKITMAGTEKQVLNITPPSPPALLANRRASLLYRGLMAVDQETLGFLSDQPELVSVLYREHAPVFARFSAGLSVRDGRVYGRGASVASRQR